MARRLGDACREFACVGDPIGFSDCSGPRGGRVQSAARPRRRKLVCGRYVLVSSRWGLGRHILPAVRCADVATAMIPLEPVAPYHRTAPVIVGAPPALARIQRRHLAAGPVTPPEGGTALLLDVTVAASGVIMTAEGNVVAESLLNTGDWSTFGHFRRVDPAAPLTTRTGPLSLQRRLAGGPFVMMKQSYDANYGHWLVECLPRLAGVAEAFNLRQCRFIVSAGHGAAMQDVYVASLGAFGIGPDQIVALNYQPVRVDTLIYPLPVTRHPWVKSPTVVPFLEALADRLPRRGRGPRRLYVSRNRGRSRRLLNEEAIVDVVRSCGFVVVHPETMAFADQVAMFRDADIVVGNYGAALTNVVFAPAGVTLFALTSEAMQDDFFWDLMDHKRGRYVSLHGRAATSPATSNSDFTVSVESFTQMLREHVRPPCNLDRPAFHADLKPVGTL